MLVRDGRPTMDRTTRKPPRVAIIGGGMGGLTTAYYLQHVYSAGVDVTIFESSGRIGGKVVSRRFDGADGPAYEAGAAELYDYSSLGPDPLRELVDDLGLTTYPMDGRAVFLGDTLVATEADVGPVLGPAAAEAVAAYTRRAKAAISPAEYYESDWRADNADPLTRQSFHQSLSGLADPAARRYVEAAVHSDVATEPRHTTAAYGLQNYLMNEPGYMRLYGIDGGLERLPEAVAARLTEATVRLNAPVTAVTAGDDDTYRLTVADGDGEGDGQQAAGPFDFCVVALPNYWLPHVRWGGPALAKAVRDHHAHYDHPAHYLRVTVRFRRPFWRDVVAGSYFMLDAFGGCCAYDESARCPDTPGGVGVLGFLLAGEAATALSNLPDDELVARVLAALPAPLRHGRELAVDGRVHRWVGAVNAKPGGYPLHHPDVRHQPDPAGHPGFYVVGDYLFDSTLNGVVDSADWVAGSIAEDVSDDAVPAPAAGPAGAVSLATQTSAALAG